MFKWPYPSLEKHSWDMYRRTGIVYNVTPSAVGVIVYKVVGNRYLEKRVNLRVEHVRHSKCRQEFLDRVKHNHEAHVAAKEKGGGYIPISLAPTTLILLFVIRTGEPETHSCSTPGISHRFDNAECPADDCTCSLRDYNLKHIFCLHSISSRCVVCHRLLLPCPMQQAKT